MGESTSSQQPATCPRCNSPSIQAVPIQKKNLGKAVLTEYFLGTAAGVAGGSTVVIQAMCLSCGCQWFPGTEQERSLRVESGQMGEKAQREQREYLAERARQNATEKHYVAVSLVAILLILGVVLYLLWGANREHEQETARLLKARDSTVAAQAAAKARPRRLVRVADSLRGR